MKGEANNCLRCGNPFTKRKKDHKFCRSACRTMYNRKKKGVAEPKFLTRGINKTSQALPMELMQSNQVEVRTPVSELAIADMQIAYYEKIIQDAGANVLPLYSFGLGGAGALFGKNPMEKIGLALVGGLIGNQFDINRKERIIKTAEENLKLWKREKRLLNAANAYAKLSIQNGNVEETRRGVLKVINTDNYITKSIPSIGFNKNTPYAYLIGDPSKNFMAMLHGLPGNGKSTFAIQFANFFQKNHGRVLYVASEQSGLNRSFQSLLKKYHTSNFDVSNNPKEHNFKTLVKASKEYGLVILDSINHIGLSVEEFEKIRNSAPNTAFLAIMQSAKDGNFKGSQEWAHNCDIIIEMKNMIAYQTKSRFAPPANMQVIV